MMSSSLRGISCVIVEPVDVAFGAAAGTVAGAAVPAVAAVLGMVLLVLGGGSGTELSCCGGAKDGPKLVARVVYIAKEKQRSTHRERGAKQLETKCSPSRSRYKYKGSSGRC